MEGVGRGGDGAGAHHHHREGHPEGDQTDRAEQPGGPGVDDQPGPAVSARWWIGRAGRGSVGEAIEAAIAITPPRAGRHERGSDRLMLINSVMGIGGKLDNRGNRLFD